MSITTTYTSPLADQTGPLLEVRGAMVSGGDGPADEAAWDTLDIAIEDGAIVADLAWLTHVSATGRHRSRFLHNMTTCEVKTLEAGATVFGMLVNDKGRIVQQLQLDAGNDTLSIEVSRVDRAATVAQMTRYRVADDVKFADDDRWHVMTVVGGGALTLLRAMASDSGVPEEDGTWAEATLGGVAIRLRENHQRLSRPGWDLLVPVADVSTVHSALVSAGAKPVAHRTWTALRVLSGWPEDQVDMGLDNVPLESERLAATMNWDKGCYIGQEVIAMMHYRGRPNRHLRRLVLAGGVADGGWLAASDALRHGTEIHAGERVVGTLGSVGYDPARNAVVALAVVKRKFSAPGTPLLIAGDVAATVDDMPFAPPVS
ncbi:MAG: folate-binding protein YgfZ [Myxococcota bacterium]|jgi:folate-binding protein YgfZ